MVMSLNSQAYSLCRRGSGHRECCSSGFRDFVRWQDLGLRMAVRKDMLVRVRRKISDRDWIGGGVRKVSEAFRVRDG